MFQSYIALKEIVLPEGITTIHWATFSDCTNLETVVLPQSVTNIDSLAFDLDNAEKRKMLTIVCPRNSYAWEFAKTHAINVQATPEDERYVVITASGRCNVRSGPGTEHEVVAYVQSNERFLVLGSETAQNGRIWYNIQVGGTSGWISSTIVRLD